MPSITLELPSAGEKITSGLHAQNYSDLQALLNGGLDSSNFDDMGASNGQALVYNGSIWTPTTLSSGPGDPVTSLPGSPVDKQQALLTDSLTAPTYAWLFQYESGISDANKWVFLGGSPATAMNATNSATTSTTFVDPTNNASITVPRAGVYVVSASAFAYKNHGTDSAGATVGLMVAGADIAQTQTSYYAQDKFLSAGFAALYNTGSIAASSVVKFRYKSSAAGGSFEIDSLGLSVIPVRVA